ncbi:MAG: metallophosphoesterase [Sphingobacteriales bacterium]
MDTSKVTQETEADDQVVERLEARLGRLHAKLRLGIEADHEAQVFGQGINYFHFENLPFTHVLLQTCLKLTGLYKRGCRNAARPILRENHIRSKTLPKAFDGFSILHLSDLHIEMSAAAMSHIRGVLPQIDYDICVLTGDYRAQTWGPYHAALAGTAVLCAAIKKPIFGVLGNHDTIRMLPNLEAMGIRMLMNESTAIERGDYRIQIAGIDDAHFYRADNIEKAASGISPGDFSILLSHTPEIYQQAAHAEFDLLLSGHTHGGQICLPGGTPITLDSVLPRRLGAGAWKYHGLTGYTSVGAGTSIAPVRFNCPPEITVHHLSSSANE